MKIPGRAIREVYRVFDEEEFLEDATRELSTLPGSHMRWGATGAFVLVVGLASVIGWLLASGHRSHGKLGMTPHERASRTAAVVVVRRDMDSSPSHARRPRRTGNRQRQGRKRGRTGPHGASQSHDRGKGSVSSITLSDGRPGVMTAKAPESQSVREKEFGFER